MPIKKYNTPLDRERALLRRTEKQAWKRRQKRLCDLLTARSSLSGEKEEAERIKDLIQEYWALWDMFHGVERKLDNEFYKQGVIRPPTEASKARKQAKMERELRVKRTASFLEEEEPKGIKGALDRSE